MRVKRRDAPCGGPVEDLETVKGISDRLATRSTAHQSQETRSPCGRPGDNESGWDLFTTRSTPHQGQVRSCLGRRVV